MSAQTHTFHLFRYQILPINRDFQHDFFAGFSSVEDLLDQKNSLFWNALAAVKRFESRGEILFKKEYFAGDLALYQFAANRSLNRETKDFKQEELDNWPAVHVLIWNDPEKQLIAIQKRTSAFQHSGTVARMVFNAVNFHLSKQNLRVHWEPLFEKSTFWSLIKNNENKIREISFELITPNMANISGALSKDLKDFARSTNTATTVLKIESDPSAALTIKDDNAAVNSLVEYSSEGGGDIKITVEGIRKKISTSKTVKEVEVSNLALSGSSKQIAEALKQILSQ